MPPGPTDSAEPSPIGPNDPGVDPRPGRLLSNPTATSTSIPWGPGGSLELAIPPNWRVIDSARPDLSAPLRDYPLALARALERPEGGEGLSSMVRPGSTVAIVVDDPSRWTPVRQALPTILDRLEALGVRRGSIGVTFGVGRHHAVDEASMRRRLGDEVVDAIACHSPPVDDLAQYEDLGPTESGVPVRVYRPVARADVRVLVGSVLPHMQAGFGGGYKLIFPGTSHRSTLNALHRRGLGGDSAATLLGGRAAANPMRIAIAEAAKKLGPCFSISHLLGPPGTILDVATGPVEAVQDRLAGLARRRFEAPSVDPDRVGAVVVGNDPWPGDPMMSFKVLLQHRSAGRPGGLLIGFFWTDPAEIDRTVPMSTLRGIAMTGAAGGWAIRRGVSMADRAMAALKAPGEFLIRWARELVVDRDVLVYSPPLVEHLGQRLGPIRLFADQRELWGVAEAILQKKGHSGPGCRIFPQGGLTYCPVRSTK